MRTAVVLVLVPLSLFAVACQPLPPDVGVAEEGLSVCPGKTTLEGIDVSTYQGTIDWAKVKASGRAFAITRVGDGLGGDNQFAANWAGIKAVGMVRGAYQFFRPGQDPIQQADILLGKIGTPQNGDLPPTLDLEVTDGQSASVITTKVKQWLEHVKAKTGRTPMVYTSPGFYPSAGSPDLSAYILWVAHWGTTCPTIPTNWKGFTFHQYSDSGTVSGISGAVDLDVFNGDKAALDALASNNTTPPADGGVTHDMAHQGDAGGASDGGTASDDLAGGGGSGGGGGDGTGGNGGKGDQPGAPMGHGCSVAGLGSVAGADSSAPLVLLVIFTLSLARRYLWNRRDQKWRRPARGPA